MTPPPAQPREACACWCRVALLWGAATAVSAYAVGVGGCAATRHYKVAPTRCRAATGLLSSSSAVRLTVLGVLPAMQPAVYYHKTAVLCHTAVLNG